MPNYTWYGIVSAIVEFMAVVRKKTSRTKRAAGITRKKVELPPIASEEMVAPPVQESLPQVGESTPKRKKTLYAVIALLLFVGLGYLLFQRGLIVASVVNGQPIFTWDLYRVLGARFGLQTLEGMVSEELIRQEAGKAGVAVTQTEIDAKEKEIIKGLGNGANIDELLKFQGITKADFDRQIQLQLTVQKILEKDVTVTDKDVDDFIEKNKASLTATEPATLREEAQRAVKDQKVGEKIQSWFTALKEKAKIIRFFH